MLIWRRLDRHFVALAAARARFRTGNKMPTRAAMIPITTSSSTSVNPALVTARIAGVVRRCMRRNGTTALSYSDVGAAFARDGEPDRAPSSRRANPERRGLLQRIHHHSRRELREKVRTLLRHDLVVLA